MKILVLILIIIQFNPVIGQVSGIVTDSVVCEKNNDHTYAVYLPLNYSTEKKWPIIYFFDPVARGIVPIKKYEHVAEKLGYIIVCTNNSRNGPLIESFEAADAVFLDTQSRFSIDTEKVYTSGFSGGSRVALALAVLSDQVSAVIGVGATESLLPGCYINEKKAFVYAGLVGILDKNYAEHKEYKSKLDKLQMGNILITSRLDHQWADASDMELAIRWIEHIHLNNEDTLFQKLLMRKVTQSSDSIPLVDKYELIQSVESKMLKDMIGIDKKAYRPSKKRQVELLMKESMVRDHLFDSIGVQLSAIELDKNTLEWIQEQSRDINLHRTESLVMEERMMYHRLFYSVFGVAFEQARLALAQNDFKRALNGMEIFEYITENYAISNFWKAKIYSRLDDPESMLLCIEKMFENGFNQKNRMLSDPDFQSIRNHVRFQELVKKY